MKRLELWDVSGDEPEFTGASATLTPSGVKYVGIGLQAILTKYLDRDLNQVFNDLDGWGNAYIALKLRSVE